MGISASQAYQVLGPSLPVEQGRGSVGAWSLGPLVAPALLYVAASILLAAAAVAIFGAVVWVAVWLYQTAVVRLPRALVPRHSAA